MKKTLYERLNILIALSSLLICVFVLRLVKYQIVDGEKYYNSSGAGTRINQTVYASRGDITDTNGNIIATSSVVYNITVNKAYMPEGELNDRIIRAVKILTEKGETLNDILPLSYEKPYKFYTDKETELSRLRKTLSVAEYATEEDIMYHLIKRYSLEDIRPEYQRILAGIRYTMEREGYSSSYPFDLAKDVSVETATQFSEISRDLVGIEVTTTSKRVYPDGTLIPHILGSVGPIYAEEYETLKNQGYGLNDILGKSGLEKAYESYLRGKDGTLQIEKNIYGEITDVFTLEEPQPGNTVSLTVDSEFQSVCNDILKSQVDMLHTRSAGWGKGTEGASMVVIDVKTGGILAVCNYPSYDLNLYSSNYNEYAQDKLTPLFNRAFQGLYRPGSVFKLSVAAAALSSGLIDENYTYTCHGVYTYYSTREWGGALPGCSNGTAHGTLNVRGAIQVSCNCFFYDLARRLGIDAVNESAQTLGLGVYTGLEVAEQEGRLSSPALSELYGNEWYPGNVIQAGIGQLDTAVTTVQLATYGGTIANRGKRLATHIVKSICSYDGKETIYETPVEVLSEMDNTNGTFEIIEKGMIQASTEGNAKIYLSELPYTVASKTGTPQVSGDLYNNTIVAYGPVENPEIAVAIIAEKGGNGYNLAYGVREVFKAYYDLKNSRTDENYVPTYTVPAFE